MGAKESVEMGTEEFVLDCLNGDGGFSTTYRLPKILRPRLGTLLSLTLDTHAFIFLILNYSKQLLGC